MTKSCLPVLALSLFLLGSCGEAPVVEKEVVVEVPATHEEWSKNATIYEVNIRQYTPEGTFNAFCPDMKRLKDMGIKILWIMPIQPISVENRKGGLGSYYAVQDYKAINPEFGNMDDFKSLVREAHALDMKVIIDWVANHSGFDNVWTKEHMDWYTLDSVGGLQPTVGTDWYDVADLNYDNYEMRAAMIDAMQFWVSEAGIDGFRCDVASMVPTDFWEACRDSLERMRPDIFMLAEANKPELLQKAFDMDYGWDLLHIMNSIAKGEMKPDAIDAYLQREDSLYEVDDYHMYFTTNHDENSWNGTVFERYGKDGHKAFAALAFLIDGMPLVYSGQEAGLDKALKFFEKDTIDWRDYPYQDFYSKLLKLHASNEALWNGVSDNRPKRLRSNADNEVYAFTRSRNGQEVVAIINLSKKRAKITFESLPSGEFSNLFDDEKLEFIAKNGIEMEPYGFHVFYR